MLAAIRLDKSLQDKNQRIVDLLGKEKGKTQSQVPTGMQTSPQLVHCLEKEKLEQTRISLDTMILGLDFSSRPDEDVQPRLPPTSTTKCTRSEMRKKLAPRDLEQVES